MSKTHHFFLSRFVLTSSVPFYLSVIASLVGPVAHADVLLGHDGRSKGCGVVEYQNADDARTAIRKLNDVVLMGRPVFVREDRESEARIGFSGGRGGGPAPSGRRDAGPSGGGGGGGSSRQVFVGNVSPNEDNSRAP